MTWALVWWLWAEALGLITFPIAFVLFRRLADRGYAFSKVLGLLLVTYGVWAAGTSRVLPNSRATALVVLGLVAVISLGLAWSQRRALGSFIRQRYQVILVVDAGLLAFFLLGLALRAYDPGVVHTEQPMDFAFLNALARSPSFPPHDPWLSGYTINYYYFGYMVWAVFAKLVGTPVSLAYNLALALTLGLAAAGAFGIVFNLVQGGSRRVRERALAFGLLGAVAVVLAGNLEGLLELAYAHNLGGSGFWSWLSIKGLTDPYLSPQWYPTQHWWWWRATRVIDTLALGSSLDYTITEFPFFSFLLGDLHPHVTALPFGLLSLALSLELLRHRCGVSRRWIGDNLGLLAVTALSLGALAFANSWDFPTYAALWLACLGLMAYSSGGDRLAWLRASALGLGVMMAAVALYLPFYRGFSPQATGIWPVLGPTTWPVHYLIIWGAFALPVVYLVVSQAGRLPRPRHRWGPGWLALGIVLVPLALWTVIALGMTLFGGQPGLGEIAWRWAKLLPLVGLMAVALAAALGHARRGSLHRGPVFALLLVAFGLGATYLSEIFYIRDLFGNRMNTVFKLYYQAWVMLALASAYAVYCWGWPFGRLRTTLWRSVKGWGQVGRSGAWVLAVALLLGGLAYPVMAVASQGAGPSGGFTLDALAPVAAARPGDYAAVQWLLRQPGLPVVLEAVGGSYTGYGRVASWTGLPTVLGWSGHEHQWRGSPRPFEGREADVDEVYRSQDPARVRALLRRYMVDYIYAGDLERARYGPTLDKFQGMFPVAFSAEGVTIYRVEL